MHILYHLLNFQNRYRRCRWARLCKISPRGLLIFFFFSAQKICHINPVAINLACIVAESPIPPMCASIDRSEQVLFVLSNFKHSQSCCFQKYSVLVNLGPKLLKMSLILAVINCEEYQNKWGWSSKTSECTEFHTAGLKC